MLIRVNANCRFDGASLLQPPYEPPEFHGPEPVVQFEGSKLYTGSCHCGAVTLALKSKALREHTSEQLLECNCSSCIRVSCPTFLGVAHG